MISPERIAELRRTWAEPCSNPDCGCMDSLVAAIPELLDEIDRLRAVIRETHYGCHILAKGRHQPDCKLYEIEP